MSSPSRLTQSLPSRLSQSSSSVAPATGSQQFKRSRLTLEGESWKRTKWESSSESELDPASSSEEEIAAFDLEAYFRFRKAMEEAGTGETAEDLSSVCSETGHQL